MLKQVSTDCDEELQMSQSADGQIAIELLKQVVSYS